MFPNSRMLETVPKQCEEGVKPPVVVQDHEIQPKFYDQFQHEGGGVNPLGYMGYAFTGFGYKKPRLQTFSGLEFMNTSLGQSTSKIYPVSAPWNSVLPQDKDDRLKSVSAFLNVNINIVPQVPPPVFKQAAKEDKDIQLCSPDDNSRTIAAKSGRDSPDCSQQNGFVAKHLGLQADNCNPSIGRDTEYGFPFPVSVSPLQLISKIILTILCLASLIVTCVPLRSLRPLRLIPPAFGLSIALVVALLGLSRSMGQYIEIQKIQQDCSYRAADLALRYNVIYR